MTDSGELQQIREDLETLKLLYQRIADDLIGCEEPSPEDIESIESRDDVLSEGEFLKMLEVPVKRSKSTVRGKRKA